MAHLRVKKTMKKIFIPAQLDETIELPIDVTHHVLHVFRHNI